MGKHKEHKSRKHRRDSKKEHRRRSPSSDSGSNHEWVEKKPSPPPARDEWMTLSSAFPTTSKQEDRRKRKAEETKRKERAQYNPSECPRELNPYWKNNGDGLPKFQKPTEHSEYKASTRPTHSSGWRKTTPQADVKAAPQAEALPDLEPNKIAAKLLKAEMLGNVKLVEELKAKLEAARSANGVSGDVILTQTDSQGRSRPLQLDEGAGSSKRRKVETHRDRERVRYFPDDDKYSLQKMFEEEKFATVESQNAEFIKLAGKVRKNDDDMDDIFTDKIRRTEPEEKSRGKKISKAIQEHERLSQTLDSCTLCLQSEAMNKHLIITVGETVCLSVPPRAPLLDGHCYLTPIRHVTNSLLLDENEWAEIKDFRRTLTSMFRAKGQDVLFFETVKYLGKNRHMFIECVPLPTEEGELAPIYFKKAIDECEKEWAQNKKLVSLKDRDVRRAVPKGLPYFFVSFGMDEGYAHVIEDESNFPGNFAHEVIGGMLDLDHSAWKKPRFQSFDEQSKRALQFSKEWRQVNDC